MALTLLLFATIVLLVNFFTLLSFGFDITDEGFYVQSVKYAEHYPFSISKFGHLLQPLWRSCSENIVCFRQTYWIIKFAFTAMIFLLLFRVQQATSIRNSPTPESIKKRKFKSFYINFVLAVSLSTTVFFQLIYWLPTPNYNTLAMFSVLLFALGVALILRNYFLLSCVAIAIAGVVSALVKATTSLALVLCTFFVLIVLLQKAGKKATLRFAVLTSLFALSLLVLIAVLISGGVCEFVTGLNQGFIFARIMIGDNWGTFNDLIWKGKLRFDSVPKEYLNLTVITSLVLVLKVVLDESLTLKKNKLIRTVNEALTLLIVGIILIVILAFFYLNVENPTPTFNAIDWFIVAWVPLLLSNIVAIIFRLTFRCWSWVDTFVVLILILLPYSYAFGTSNSYVTQMIGGFVFIALTSSYIQKNIDHLIIVGAFCVLVVCMILPINGREMYRQPSLSSMSNNENFKVITGGSLNGIKASSDVVNYFVNLNELLSEAGVALVPGSAFGAPGCMRLSFATSMEILEDAIARLKKVLV